MVVLVFGDADALYTGTDGGQWGWRPDGTLIDNLKGAKSISPLGTTGLSNRKVMLALPITNPPPLVQINVRGSHYFFHAAQGGRLLQLEQCGGVPGDRDEMSMGYDNGRLSLMRFSPQHRATNFIPRIGMVLGERERAVFEWRNLAVAAKNAVQFKALSTQRGVEFRNDTSSTLYPTLTLIWVDGASSTYGTNVFDPVEVPPGAVQRLFIHNWPTATQMRSELDLNRDGEADQVAVLAAKPRPHPLLLEIATEKDHVVLSWTISTHQVHLEAAASLNQPIVWVPATQAIEIIGQTTRVVLPVTSTQQFFRLSE
jgi:hypothetical protein